MSGEGLPWGEMPYDGKTPREVVDDYVLIRGDLVAEYAREQLATWIERYATHRESEAAEKALAPIERLLASFGHVRDEDHGDDDDWPCVRCDLDRAITQGRADSVAQGREEGDK
jgi:hypothetical protein